MFRRPSAHCAVVLIAIFGGAAEVVAGPKSFDLDLDLAGVAHALLPWVDEARCLTEDSAREAAASGGGIRFAATHQVDRDLAEEGTWIDLGPEGRLCRWRIESIGARSLNLGFTTFDLPAGASLHVYAPDRAWVGGPFTAEDAREGEFWSPIFPGDALIVELFVPAEPEPRVVLGSVQHDYRGFGRSARQGNCNNDVVCPEADPWREEVRSVGLYTRNGAWRCTGQLVNSYDPARPPYFLTADHCGISIANDQTVVVYWNFESPSCGDLCCGDLSEHTSGSVLLAHYAFSDFSLLRLSSGPDSAFDVVYSGWDARETAQPARTISIHHPNTDEKAISFDLDPPTVTSHLSSFPPGNGSHWRIERWDDGTTEPGSSGGGLWDENHRLIGQLHGGYASCDDDLSDWFGRLSRSWDGGGAASSRLRDWLDPDGTGGLVLDHHDPDESTSIPGATARLRVELGVRPHPAKGAVHLHFSLEREAVVSWEIFDVTGRRLLRANDERLAAGSYERLWSAPPAPGVYLARLILDGETGGSRSLLVVE